MWSHQAPAQTDPAPVRVPVPGLSSRPTPSGRQQWWTVLAAAVAPLVAWLLVDPVLGVDLVAGRPGSAVDVGGVDVAVSGAVAALGALVVSRMTRRTSRPRGWFLSVSSTVLAASLLGPLGAATAAAGLSLALMHLVVAAAVVPVTARRLPRERVARSSED